MERVGSLYYSTMDYFKMEQLNEEISNLTGIYTMSIINIINLPIVLSLKE